MRFNDGLYIDSKATFGVLKFVSLESEKLDRDDKGEATGEVLKRRYNLKSTAQGMLVSVSIPVEAGEKNYPVNSEVELVNPVIYVIAEKTFGDNAKAVYYCNCEDIVLKTKTDTIEKAEQKKEKFS